MTPTVLRCLGQDEIDEERHRAHSSNRQGDSRLRASTRFSKACSWRAEYRYDWSNEPFFERGGGSGSPYGVCTKDTPAGCPAGFGLQNSKDQNTLTIAFIGFFGPKR